MRHSRSDPFDSAMAEAASRPAVQRWTDVASDPNDPRALAARAETLRRAWRPPVHDRIAFLADRCRGKQVLDIGCVAHDEARMDSPQWLHRNLAAAAARCIGVDVLEDGVTAMRQRGYEAFTHDLHLGLGPLTESAPFDIVVAGELIEHIGNLAMLFQTAADALGGDGELIITTPNPYAPSRVKAGQRGWVCENVDHITYAFPSGIAELAERHGLVLVEAMTTSHRPPRGSKERLKQLVRVIRGTRWMFAGYTTRGTRAVRHISEGPLRWALSLSARFAPWFRGETFIYVVRRGQEGTGHNDDQSTA